MRTVIFLALLLISAVAFSQSLSKSFGFLNSGAYDLAQTSFQKILKDNPQNGAAQFGMAKLFFMKDFNQYNLDSANAYNAASASRLTKDRTTEEKKQFPKVGYRDYTVNELQQLINSEAYRFADSVNTGETWNHFINTFATSPQLAATTEKRNSAAFNEALLKNDYASFDEFLKKYPAAKQVAQARALYEKYLYNSKTADSTWQSYKNFITQYPNSPYYTQAKANYDKLLYSTKTKSHRVNDYITFTKEHTESPYFLEAEDTIYLIITRDDSVKRYLDFINLFPSNHNVENAWMKIYRKETAFYSYNTFKNFQKKYPFYPNQLQLEKEMKQSTKKFESFEKNNLYGYIDSKSRDTLARAQFTEASPFSEGMAAVKLACNTEHCNYAFINADGKIMSTYPWSKTEDFNEGKAQAAIGDCHSNSCKYGFVNRFGEWIIHPRYENIFDFTEGLSMVHNENKGYGFIDSKGREVIPLKFVDATSFNEGFALVQVKESKLYGFIDHSGKFAIEPMFQNAGSFREDLAPVADDSKLWGYIDKSGSWIIKPQYEYASLFINGKARVRVKAKDPKNSKLTILVDKVIDKNGKFVKG
ncbi:MAG: WG repeat-containing protein [Chitinophagales bacterium]|nr:WG repeat-containing protein [Chitinophagales bacterium]